MEPKETTPRREENSVLVDESEHDPSHKQVAETEEEEDEEEEEEARVPEKTDSEVPPPSSTEEEPEYATTKAPAPAIDLCQVANGGCDHNCRFAKEDHDPQGRVECSCFSGFNLNADDGRTCHGESPV